MREGEGETAERVGDAASEGGGLALANAGKKNEG